MNLRHERRDLKLYFMLGRPDFRSERLDMRLGTPDLRSETSDGKTTKQTDGWTDKVYNKRIDNNVQDFVPFGAAVQKSH